MSKDYAFPIRKGVSYGPAAYVKPKYGPVVITRYYTVIFKEAFPDNWDALLMSLHENGFTKESLIKTLEDVFTTYFKDPYQWELVRKWIGEEKLLNRYIEPLTKLIRDYFDEFQIDWVAEHKKFPFLGEEKSKNFPFIPKCLKHFENIMVRIEELIVEVNGNLYNKTVEIRENMENYNSLEKHSSLVGDRLDKHEDMMDAILYRLNVLDYKMDVILEYITKTSTQVCTVSTVTEKLSSDPTLEDNTVSSIGDISELSVDIS